MSVTNSGISIPAPATAPSGTASGSAGALSAGDYQYKVTYVSVFGETLAGTASDAITAVANNTIALTSIPVSDDAGVTGRKIYRTDADGTTYSLLTTISDNTTTTYSDGVADASLGAAEPVWSTADAVQTISGSFIGGGLFGSSSVETGITALAGGGQSGATQLTKAVNIIGTCATAADSVILPPLSANYVGAQIYVRNNGAAACAVFPASGQTINAGAANASVSVTNGVGTILYAASATNWQTLV